MDNWIVKTAQQILDRSPVGQAESLRLLVEWNQTQANYPLDRCIHDLIASQAEQSPLSIAITFGTQQLTYRELNHRANQLAHYLQSLAVGPEVLVGICLERSLDLVVGLLGILKAGGAYVPLDPAYPQERLGFMLADSQLPVLITQSSQLAKLPQHRARVVCLDTDWEAIAQLSSENPSSSVTIENLAYTIYTSGSTGQPKGVQIEHRAAVNFLHSMRRAPGLTSQDVLLAVTTICFDIAALEIYLPLIVGAQIVLVSREIAADAAQLSQAIAESSATVMQATPATWRLLLASGWQGSKDLKILCGGEALTRGLANQLLEKVHSLWNMYGPTETTIWSTVCQVEPGNDSVPIGRPIANTQIYLLDPLLRRQEDPIKLVPIGVAGELCIGGDGLARGYLNRPQLNQEKFIPNPFSQQPGARLYKTGDLARYLPNGNIEFIGRIDHQVKIRGYRIELGDIEAAISQYPAVREAVVIACQDLSDDNRLVAYFVPKSPKAIASQVEQTWQWQQIWNETYSHASVEVEPTFNISGWQDSYTGLLTSVEEMREWVDCTVERILSLQPQHVLELGCGTGLLLFRIAPYCSHYLGTDISPSAIDYIEQQLPEDKRSHVTLRHQPALVTLAEVEPAAFDTVILNSVIQYFPTIDYLVRVLENAVQTVKPGGRIFIGDVRSLPLLEAFHTSVQLYQAPDSLLTRHLQQRIQERRHQEQELVIAPAFFTALQQSLPQISRVQIQLKRGHYHNELTRFRYDVVLQVGTEAVTTREPLRLDWQPELTLSAIRQYLSETEPELLVITGIKNARLLADIAAGKLLADSDRIATVGDLRAVVQKMTQTAEAGGIDPEALWNLSQELPYTIEIDWSSFGELGSYNAICHRLTEETNQNYVVALSQSAIAAQSWSQYANHPLQVTRPTSLCFQLRVFLKDKLPDYMIPFAFVCLESLPLTPNGKVDRRALPAPNRSRPILQVDFVAPSTPVEKQLAEIWTQLLGIEPIGIHDNFFELGGHSLLAVQLLTRIKGIFRVGLPLLSLFQFPTVFGLAQAIDSALLSGATATFDNLTEVDLNAEAVLDPTICPPLAVIAAPEEPQRIFLTGATGFIGAFLLYELLQQTQADIYCLVRASSWELGKQKISQTLASYSLWYPEQNFRIIPVIGDLAQPLLGLTESQFAELSTTIDAIYHNGALVNLIYPYTALRAANVSGTQEVLRLASAAKIKPVHFISTLDVFQSPAYSQLKVIREQDDLADGTGLTDGYAQSKWVAEKLVMAARDRGIPTCIYRLGMISGHSQTGASKTDDLISRLIKGLIQLRSAPELELSLNLAPVDYVSSAIVHLSRQQASLGQAFHLINPRSLSLSQLVKQIKAFGYTMKQIPYEAWQAALLHAAAERENALSPLASLFTEKVPGRQQTYLETSSLVSPAFDAQNTLNGLAGTAIVCPAVDARLLSTYFAYFTHSGFLKSPLLPTDN